MCFFHEIGLVVADLYPRMFANFGGFTSIFIKMALIVIVFTISSFKFIKSN